MTQSSAPHPKISRAEIDKAAKRFITEKYSTPETIKARSQLVCDSALYAMDADFNIIEITRGCKRPKQLEWQRSLLKRSDVTGGVFDDLGNYGIKTGQQLGIDEKGQIVPLFSKPWLLVIDFDRNKKLDSSQPLSALQAFKQAFIEREGEETYVAFMKKLGRARSPNGMHGYCVLPLGIRMKGKVAIYKFPVEANGDGSAIDLRCENNQVLAHGSEVATVQGENGTIVQHGGTYSWCEDSFRRFEDLPTLPMSMCDWFRDALIEDVETPESLSRPFDDAPIYAKSTEKVGLSQGMSNRAPADPSRVKAALMHSVSAFGTRYQDRDAWRDGILFPLAGAVGTAQLQEEVAKSIYDAACDVAHGDKSDNEDQWAKAVAAAKLKARAAEPLRGCKTIIEQARADGWQDPSPEPDSGPEWPGGYTAKGIPLLNALNAEAQAKRLGFDARLNLRRHEHEVLIPSKFVAAPSAIRAGWARLDDAVLRLVTHEVSKSAGRSFQNSAVDEALMLMGERHSFDPVLDKFEGIDWDNVARLDTWLSAYLGVVDNPLHRQWARLWLVAGVARTQHPGCKWDFVLMLSSEEGLGKSSIGRALVGDEYFTDQLEIGADSKQVIEQTAGALIVEIGEMRGMGSRDMGAIKHMISAQSDKARLAYDRKVTERLRRFIMYGTTNFDTPLQDQSGNRRFWTVKVAKILLDELKRDAPQLWAEAIHIFKTEFKADPALVKLDEKFFEEAREVQNDFTEAPVWEGKLANYLKQNHRSFETLTLQDGKQVQWVSTSQVMDALAPNVDLNAGHTRKLAEAMRGLGCKGHRHRGARGYALERHLCEPEEASK